MADKEEISVPLEDLTEVSIICKKCSAELKVKVSDLKEETRDFIKGRPRCLGSHEFPLNVYVALSHLQRYFHLIGEHNYNEAAAHLKTWFHKLGAHPVRFSMKEPSA